MSVGEDDMAVAVMKIANAQANGLASFGKLRRDIPQHVSLSAADVRVSGPRNPEPMWHQIFRNIKSHSTTDGNAIKEGLLEHVSRTGYRITAKGKAHLAEIA